MTIKYLTFKQFQNFKNKPLAIKGYYFAIFIDKMCKNSIISQE